MDNFLDLNRLLRIVIRSGGHWLWRGAIDCDGYGRVTLGERHWRAHRLIWTLLEGELKEGSILHHLCYFRACVFPCHLTVLGSHHEHARKHRLNRVSHNPKVAFTGCPQ